jgi:hypothetical protein
MTDFANQNSNLRERLETAAPLVGLAVGVAAIVIAITNFLGFLATECTSGTAHLTAIFVCIPPN